MDKDNQGFCVRDTETGIFNTEKKKLVRKEYGRVL